MFCKQNRKSTGLDKVETDADVAIKTILMKIGG